MKADALEDPAHLSLAAHCLKEATAIYDQLHDTLSILNGITAMADYYLSSGNADSGITVCLKGIEIVNRGFAYPLAELYWTLAQCYKKAGNANKYAETLNAIISINDATYKKNSENDLAELNAKYELSNKEAFIARQKLDLLRKNIWIAFACILAILIGGSAWLLLIRSRRRQHIALKEAEEKERRRIAADLHDNIGAYASAISAGIEEMEIGKVISDPSSIENLKVNVAEIMNSLRDTIWAFNKESVPLTGLSDRVKTHVQKIQPNYSSIKISVEENIAVEKNLSPVVALHLFRIIQEALHNSVKHSGGSIVVIDIHSDEKSMGIFIQDNGKGFDTDVTKQTGNGLINMKNRAAESGYALTFTRTLPLGMKIGLNSGSTG